VPVVVVVVLSLLSSFFLVLDGNTTLTTLLHTFATDLCHWYTALAAWHMRWINQPTSARDTRRGPHTQAAHNATSANHHRRVAWKLPSLI
jgi:hypothetical protein